MAQLPPNLKELYLNHSYTKMKLPILNDSSSSSPHMRSFIVNMRSFIVINLDDVDNNNMDTNYSNDMYEVMYEVEINN